MERFQEKCQEELCVSQYFVHCAGGGRKVVRVEYPKEEREWREMATKREY